MQLFYHHVRLYLRAAAASWTRYDDKKTEPGCVAYDSSKSAFGGRFQYEDNGQVHHYLGMEVIYDRAAGTLSLV